MSFDTTPSEPWTSPVHEEMDRSASLVLPTLDFSSSFPVETSSWAREPSTHELVTTPMSDLEFHNAWTSLERDLDSVSDALSDASFSDVESAGWGSSLAPSRRSSSGSEGWVGLGFSSRFTGLEHDQSLHTWLHTTIVVPNSGVFMAYRLAMKGQYDEELVLTSVPRPRSKFPGRLLRLAGFIIAGTALSTLFHTPWTRHGSHQTVERTEDPLATFDAASEWKDDIWPIRQQTPWDISTDYPYPRKLVYDVTEGTWLRLDVHPRTGDIVFDMLGDLYCLPGDAYRLGIKGPNRAAPVLLGVPHDSDPHFSPDGSKLVFRSDAELGVENIWVMNWTDCESMDVRPDVADGALFDVLKSKNNEEELLAQGVRETPLRKQRRLVREGRAAAHRVTNETYRWVSDARFHPSGTKVIATKWYTSGRSLGAGEGWEYNVPKNFSSKIEAGSGKRLIGRTLPPGWGPSDYGDQQIGPEQYIWSGNDSVIYSKNVIDTNGQWTYSKDVHTGIYAIFSTNLTTHKTTTLVSSFPGGASRPELSRDGRTLAFVRRVRDKEALVLKDLVTGTIRNIWHGLTYDLTTVSAPMGTYPSFAFTPNDDAIIIWAAGQPVPIPFIARVEKRIAATLDSDTDILHLETRDKQRVHAFTELRTNEDGSKATFQASGATYVYALGKKGKGRLQAVPVLHPDAPYYSPSFVPGADDLIIHARWSDLNFTTFELANVTSGKVSELTGLPLGRYYSPILCECAGLNRKIAFIKTSGDYLSGDIVATAGAGLYVGDLTLPSPSSKSDVISVKHIHFITEAASWDSPAQTKLRFLEKNAKILIQQSSSATIIDLAAGPDKFGEYQSDDVAYGRMSTELVVAAGSSKTINAAVVDFFHVYFAPNITTEDAIWSKPGSSTKNLVRLSLDGGHDIVWSADGKRLSWFLGPFLHSIEISKLAKCSSEVAHDSLNYGISCTKKLLDIHEITVEYPTDISRLKDDALAAMRGADETAQANADVLVITNATLLTMETGSLQSDVIHHAVLFTRNGRVEAIGGSQDAVIPEGAMLLDAEGGFITPGFIDVHAHWNGFSEFYPARSWELQTFLAYGVTTLHNPSADNVRGFWERFRVERGQEVGPRIFQVGDIIYGAGYGGIHQDITTLAEAHSALIRIKAEGGPASYSYKNYNLPSRASRQRMLLAARNLSMLCVPEGGMNYDWDQTYIVDGMTTIEHPLPIPRLYDDVLTLFALSGTGSTPTHIVNYGGVFGEQYVWATEDIPNDPKLRRFTRHDILESLSESTARPRNSYALFNTSESTAKMIHMGLKAHIGAHGEPPLGLNYHAEMFFATQGGLTNYEVIRAATSDAAKTLGIFSAVGSLTPGKLADFIIFPPGFDVLEDDIRKSRNIQYVVRGGRVWDAETMVEVWPNNGRRSVMPPLNPE
ncbi:hypothetical protein NM688_g5104 [Phlebia brevispora]|uniref:Uncharacterized protein n=1 Tax=Phlebia brevispora TaxID=194682 RepID=A0ACC1T0Q8_9APHY|nr:hypothetical protein NM688_g5104 [Phlebia brevispora]